MPINSNSKYTPDDQAIIARNSLMTSIQDEIFFGAKFPMRLQLKPLNVVKLEDIDGVLVSTFQELYGLPYLVRARDRFRGKVYMTQAMAQIGKATLIEFVNLCQERNQESIDYVNQSGVFGLCHNSQGQGESNSSEKYNQGSSNEWIEQDQLFEICQNLGVHDWQDIYTEVDVEALFDQFVVVLNHNEIHYLTNEKTISLSSVASGVHIGSSNWVLNVQGETELSKFGIVTNCCLEGQYRYPKQVDTQGLAKADCLLLSSGLLVDSPIFKVKEHEDDPKRPKDYPDQILSLVATIQDHLSASPNAKVVLPVQPTFLLELVDHLLHKIQDQVSIVVLSESAHSVVEYSNINLEYLNQKLQAKIYNTEQPLSFDKLLSSNRLKIFSSVQEYLNSKKASFSINQNKIVQNEFQRELFITSHESLRLGEATYLMQNMNM